MPAAVLYLRVSTEEQVENTSLATQEDACRRFCASRGYTVARVFRDEGVSAKTTDRPQLQQLLKYCRTHGKATAVAAVVVHSTSRLARDSYGYHLIVSLLRKQGIALWSATEPFADDAVGNLVRGVLASIAQFDNEQKGERVVTAMKAAAAAGRWLWQPPYGYRPAKDSQEPANDRQSLVIDCRLAVIVRQLFAKAADGLESAASLAAWLEHQWALQVGPLASPSKLVRRLLTNPTYKGRLVVASWGLDVPGDWEPLVSPEIWARAQLVLVRRQALAKPKRRPHDDFPLRGHLVDEAGRVFSGSWSKGHGGRYAYYHHDKGRVARDVVHEAFLLLLEQLRPSEPVLRLWRRLVTEERAAELAELQQVANRLRRRLEDVQAKRRRLLDAYLAGKVDEDLYDATRLEMDEQSVLLEAELAETRIDEVDLEGQLAYAERLLSRLGRIWLEATVEDKARLQAALFPAGLCWDLAEGGFRTPVTCSILSRLRSLGESEAQVVPHLGQFSNFMRDLRAIFALGLAA